MLRSLRLVSFLSLAALAALAVGCRDSGSGDDDPIDGGTDSSTTGLTIQEVQNDAMVPGTPVDLRGKVVLAIDNFGNRKGNFWIGEEAGGEFSGVLVFGGPLDQVALLAVGDKVDITGAEKTEFALTADTSGRTTTELQPVTGGAMTVTKVGTGTVPAAQVIDGAILANMDEATRFAEYEKWEGVLTRVNNVAVTSGISQIGGTMPDPMFREFVVTGGLHIDSSLAAIPSTADGGADLVALQDCLASVTGIGDYFFSYKILPRATADIVPGGTGCPAPQSTTVENVQTGAVATGAAVQLADVVVTAISFNKKNLWVADRAAAAPNQGVYVFRGGSSVPELPATVVVGAHVSVAGTVSEFGTAPNTVTEITAPTVTVIPSTPIETVTPLQGVAIATLVDRTAGEPYEGVLVQLTNVRIAGPQKVLVPPAPFPTNQRPLAIGTTMFEEDDDIYRMTTEITGNCYATMTGVWHYNTFADTDNWVFLPRGASDLSTPPLASCP